ncbi:DNA replication protein DnaB [Tetragenococcus halophilus subsp. halophilus]|uniref:DNA replication protein DnaB n=2 Tax=Tetragenococcus halophilus TaxID=51669 RepID=A0A2H6CZ50_TETHA|nr:DnaD domain protein [Tetragenococcus halophilus]AOF48908.1 helicase DnaB [Tetragenococcus halophilus]MCO7026356.1 DnaD domain protein [Tetragenococcus halophilus]NWN99157.1 helicase DnaB [Tetragenococcus halophilus]BAK94828.1 DNA replication protein DnaB [Tetragenococcus halophilus NBRC 12172]GBD69072.1 DNA replication protein DnaB [Tetragenococcus halophilus subsp. halophilus]
MHSAWDEVQPNNIYQVTKSFPLTEEGNNGLVYLYQPIIGQNALALYYGFIGDKEDQYENEFAHIDMLDALNIGLPDFLQARKQLEGMGLLSVFTKEDPEFGKMFLYRLEEPIHPQDFFRDETYSFLLLNTIGERKFRQMVRRFQPENPDLTAYQEVTSGFREVYGALDERLFIRNAQSLEKVSQDYQVPSNKQLQLDEGQIDWDFLYQLAQRKFIVKENFDDSFKQQLTLYANLFGFDEMKLVDLMTEAVSLSDGKVGRKALDKVIRKQATVKKEKQADNYDEQSDEQKRRFNTLRQTGFSENDIQLVKIAQSSAPMDFLQAIKNEKHNFVTDPETWLLKTLVERSPLPNSVINVLIHYILVVKKNSFLQSNFVNQIATDWSELEINSPEQAIKHVRDLVKEVKNKPSKKKNYANNKQQPIRKESLPDWVDKPNEEVEDPAVQEEINKKLQDYLKRKEGES